MVQLKRLITGFFIHFYIALLIFDTYFFKNDRMEFGDREGMDIFDLF